MSQAPFDWPHRFFVEKAELCAKVLDSERMLKRGEELALAIADYLKKRGVKDGVLLEVGCGTGRIAVPLARRGYQVVGVDISESFIRMAKARAEREGVVRNTAFVVCDAREMKEALKHMAPFDSILFIYTTVIGYYDRKTDVKILKECAELSKEGSLLLILDTSSHDLMAFRQTYFGGMTYYDEVDDLVIIEMPTYDPKTSKASSKWIYFQKRGKDLIYLDEACFEARLYSLHELIEIAEEAGWAFVEAYGDLVNAMPFRPIGRLNVIFELKRRYP